MSCILLATLGSLGDLHPYLAVGRALVARGRRVRLATSIDYRERVAAAGIEFAPLAPSIAALGDPEQVARRFFDRWRGPERLFDAMVTAPLHRACADLGAALEGAALAVAHPLVPALPMLAESRGVPWLSSVLAPYSLFSKLDPSVIPGLEWLHRLPRLGAWPHAPMLGLVSHTVSRWERPLRALRAQLGLPPLGGSLLMGGLFCSAGTLALFDEALAAPQPDWPPRTFLCGAALSNAGESDEAAASAYEGLERFLEAGPPPLIFALGSSAVWIAGDYWSHAIDACRALGMRGLLLTGKPLPQRLPRGVAAFDYLPYSRVFSRGAAVIHQAGIGTLSWALRSGRPQLLTPAGFDQPDNAARAARLGVGRVLPFRRAHGTARLVRELRALLGNPAYGKAAAALAPRMLGIDGAGVAAERIIDSGTSSRTSSSAHRRS